MARESGDQIDRGIVDPVKIFEDQQQRVESRDCLQCLDHLPEHALRGGTQRFPLQGFPLFPVQQAGELKEPGGRLPRERVEHGGAVGTATQLAEGFEHGIERLLAPEPFHALAPGDPNRGLPGGGLPLKFLRQGRLADARLAGDEDDLPLAGQGVSETVPQLGQRAIPPDQAAGQRGCEARCLRPWR